MPVRFFNGRHVEVITDKPAFGKSSCHQQSRKTDAAANIGDARSRLQLRFDSVKRRQPVLYDVVHVARPEERACRAEQTARRIAPAHAGTGAERMLDLWLTLDHSRH